MGRLKEIKDKLAAEEDTEDKKWHEEIQNLEGRTKKYRDIDLGDGTTISVLERLPEELEELFKKFREKYAEAEKKEAQGKLDPKEKEKLQNEYYEWLAILCQNPLLTADYFQNNKSKYATGDILFIIFAYYERLGQRVEEQIKKIEKRSTAKKFRGE
jgi:hypothetical protein